MTVMPDHYLDLDSYIQDHAMEAMVSATDGRYFVRLDGIDRSLGRMAYTRSDGVRCWDDIPWTVGFVEVTALVNDAVTSLRSCLPS